MNLFTSKYIYNQAVIINLQTLNLEWLVSLFGYAHNNDFVHVLPGKSDKRN